MKQLISPGRAVALALLVTIAAFTIALPGSAQDSTATEIDSCTAITDPGRYVLIDDIESDTERRCIDISAEDVTLDGAGHTIDGSGTGIGIGAGDFAGGGGENATVMNVTVTNWGTGIYYEAVPGGAIRDSVVESNFRGISLGFFTDDVEVTDNTIVDNRVGLGTTFSTDNVFENNTVSDSEEADYESEGDRDEEGPSSATVRDLRLDTATLSFDEDIQFGALRLDATESAPSDPDDRRNVGQYVDVRSNSPGNGTLRLGVHYTDDDVEEAGVDEESLRLFAFADGEWTELPNSAVDTDANVVTMSVDNLSVLDTESVVAPLGQPADDGAANGDDGDADMTEIDSCTEISEPGRYVLTEDIENSNENACIRITADDVVFDGDGHTIDGVDRSGTEAVSVALDGANFTVTNVAVTDWGVGVVVDADGEGIISHNAIASNGIGINLLSSDVTVTENTITDNQGLGISLETGVRYTITDNTVSSNGAGILFDDEITQTVVLNNTVTGNQGTGIAITDFSSGQLSDNLVSDNAIGIEVTDSTGFIEDTIASGNSQFDFVTESPNEPSATSEVETFSTDSATLSFEAKNLALTAVDTPPDGPDGVTNVGGHVEVADGEGGVSFVILEMHYDDEDAQGVDEDSLRLYRFADGEWEPVSGSSVDTSANVVSANVTEFPAESFVVAPFGSPASDGEGGDGSNGGDGSDGNESASDGDTGGDGDTDDPGSCRDVTVAFDEITISDLELAGPGLSDTHIDERTYEIGGFDIDTEGVSVTIDGKDYSIGCLSVVVEPFTVTLEDITLGDA